MLVAENTSEWSYAPGRRHWGLTVFDGRRLCGVLTRVSTGFTTVTIPRNRLAATDHTHIPGRRALFDTIIFRLGRYRRSTRRSSVVVPITSRSAVKATDSTQCWSSMRKLACPDSRSHNRADRSRPPDDDRPAMPLAERQRFHPAVVAGERWLARLQVPHPDCPVVQPPRRRWPSWFPPGYAFVSFLMCSSWSPSRQ
jgi:hypothetical protein